MAEWVCGAADRQRATRVPGPGALILGESHLRRILFSYASYYNEVRTHLALSKDTPLGRRVQRSGVVVGIQSCRDCITTTSGYDFRKGQPIGRSIAVIL